MDSITQIALGAAVGEAILDRRAGRRALLWGIWRRIWNRDAR